MKVYMQTQLLIEPISINWDGWESNNQQRLAYRYANTMIREHRKKCKTCSDEYLAIAKAKMLVGL